VAGEAWLYRPGALAFDAAGNLYVTASFGERVFEIKPGWPARRLRFALVPAHRKPQTEDRVRGLLRLVLVGCALAALAVPAGAASVEASAGKSAPRAASVGGACSKQTAQQLTPDRVAGVLCGSFLGPGSTTMVLMTTSGVCAPFATWDLYQLSGGSWQRVDLPGHGGYSGVPVAAVGNDLRETILNPSPGQPICLATATKSRVWHWDGQAFVPGPWSLKGGGAQSGGAAGNGLALGIFSPSRNIQCEIYSGGRPAPPFAGCTIFSPPGSAGMKADGRLSTCHGKRCIGNFDEGVTWRTLPYGRTITNGPFRCSSETTGITCVSTKTGKGFRIARQAITRIG
jgi:hypothetical protein